MEPLPPIPSPFAARWRRHRLALTHLLVFGALCAAIVLAWRQVQQPARFVGQVEVLQTVVSSRDDGFITNLWVFPLQEVNTGDLVAEVITTDPRTVNNRLEVMRDRMRLTQLEMEPILNRQRGALSAAAAPGATSIALALREKISMPGCCDSPCAARAARTRSRPSSRR